MCLDSVLSHVVSKRMSFRLPTLVSLPRFRSRSMTSTTLLFFFFFLTRLRGEGPTKRFGVRMSSDLPGPLLRRNGWDPFTYLPSKKETVLLVRRMSLSLDPHFRPTLLRIPGQKGVWVEGSHVAQERVSLVFLQTVWVWTSFWPPVLHPLFYSCVCPPRGLRKDWGTEVVLLHPSESRGRLTWQNEWLKSKTKRINILITFQGSCCKNTLNYLKKYIYI